MRCGFKQCSSRDKPTTWSRKNILRGRALYIAWCDRFSSRLTITCHERYIWSITIPFHSPSSSAGGIELNLLPTNPKVYGNVRCPNLAVAMQLFRPLMMSLSTVYHQLLNSFHRNIYVIAHPDFLLEYPIINMRSSAQGKCVGSRGIR